MLRTRLWMGSVLIGLAAGVVVFDERLAPWYPFLFIFILFLVLGAGFELLHMLDSARRPDTWFALTAVTALIAANWLAYLVPPLVPALHLNPDPWQWLFTTFTLIVLATFLYEMAVFREPGAAVVRMALTIWVVAYLGLLPSFLAQLRWTPFPDGAGRCTLVLALAIFVPKSCDIGAYFVGKFFGKHKMAPILSPKKTLEGAAAGLAAAAGTAIALDSLGPVLHGGIPEAALFGFTLGLVSMFGDLAESLIKRDCQSKDASQVVPGFGGLLDVIDSVVYAAPVAYWWLH